MATKIVGLDLGTHTVKVCELVATLRNFDWVGFDTELVFAQGDNPPTHRELAQAAKRLLDRRGLTGETIVCALPPGLASTVILELPFDQKKKIEMVLPFQLDEVLPFDVEEVIYDYQVVTRREDGTARVMAAYVKRERLAEFMESIESVGLDPKVITLGALSSYNLYEHLMGAEDEPACAVLDIGHGHSELAIFHEGEPALTRDIRCGGANLTAALAEAFQVDLGQAERGKLAEGFVSPPGFDPGLIETEGQTNTTRRSLVNEACRSGIAPLVREIRRSFAAFELANGAPVNKLLLTGGGSQLKGLIGYLSNLLRLEVRHLDPLGVPFNRLTGPTRDHGTLMAKSLALSVRAHGRTNQSELNFRRGDFAYTGELSFLRGRILTLAAAAMVLIVLASVGAITKKRVLEAEYESLKREVTTLSMPILGFESDDVDLLFNQVASTNTKVTATMPTHSAFRMLFQLSDVIDEDLTVDIDRVDIDVERKNMTMKGKTSSGDFVERVVESFKKAKCFQGQVSKERVEKSVDDRTKFRLKATTTCG